MPLLLVPPAARATRAALGLTAALSLVASVVAITFGGPDHEAAKRWLDGSVSDPAISVEVSSASGRCRIDQPLPLAEFNRFISGRAGLGRRLPVVGRPNRLDVRTASGKTHEYILYVMPSYSVIFEGNDDQTAVVMVAITSGEPSRDLLRVPNGADAQRVD